MIVDNWEVAWYGSVGLGCAAAVVVSTTSLAPSVPAFALNDMTKSPGAVPVLVASTDVPTAWSASALSATLTSGRLNRRSLGRSKCYSFIPSAEQCLILCPSGRSLASARARELIL